MHVRARRPMPQSRGLSNYVFNINKRLGDVNPLICHNKKGGSLPLVRTPLLTTPSVALSQPMGPKGLALKNPKTLANIHHIRYILSMKNILFLSTAIFCLFGCSDDKSAAAPAQPKEICHEERYCETKAFAAGCVKYSTREVCDKIRY